MSYRPPAFMISNPFADLGPNSITLSGDGTTPATTDDKRAWVDRRSGDQGSFESDAAGASIFMFSATTPTCNAAVIAGGHNLAGEDVEAFSDGSQIVQDSVTAVADEVLEFGWAAVSNQIFGIRFPDSLPPQVFSMGEIAFGQKVEITEGLVQSAFDREFISTVTTAAVAGRTATVELAPPRRAFSLRVRYVVPGSVDMAILEEVIRDGVGTPFWYWPPDDDDPGPFLVRLSQDGTRFQETRTPRYQVAYDVTLEMVEQL